MAKKKNVMYKCTKGVDRYLKVQHFFLIFHQSIDQTENIKLGFLLRETAEVME